MGILIDEKGKLHRTGTRGSAIPVAGLFPETDAIAAAVRWLGFVYVEQVQRSLIIMFRPGLVSAAAVSRLYFTILDRRPDRILLSYGLNDRAKELYTDIQATVDRIEELLRAVRGPAIRSGIVANREPLAAASTVASGRMATLLAAWRETGGSWSADLYGMLRRAGLLSDTLVVRSPPRQDDFIIEHWGSKRQLLGRDWARRARGRDIRDQPYPQLADWVVSTLREARREQQPRLDDVQAVVITGHGTTRRRRYHRLLLPFRSGAKETFSLVINITREPEPKPPEPTAAGTRYH